MKIEEAIIAKCVWKSDEMDTYITAFLEAALRLPYVNNDDVHDHAQPLDKTTVGTAIKLLLIEHIIQPFHGNVPLKDIWGGMRRSTRACCNGHRNPLYTLTNAGLARAWLAAHGYRVPSPQMDLFADTFSRQLGTGKGCHAADAVDAPPVPVPGTGLQPIVKGTETATADAGQQRPALVQADGIPGTTFLPLPSLGKAIVPEFQSSEKS